MGSVLQPKRSLLSDGAFLDSLSLFQVDEMVDDFNALDPETHMVDYHRVVKGMMSV